METKQITDTLPDSDSTNALVEADNMANTDKVTESEESDFKTIPIDMRSIIANDARAAHFIIDILAGVKADEAIETHFPKQEVGEQQLAEAEQRGYLRGRNESVSAVMAEPTIYETSKPSSPIAEENRQFLSSPRRSVWD